MNTRLMHRLFELGITLKFINGVLEILGAILFFFASSNLLSDFLTRILTPELIEDPNDILLNFLFKHVLDISVGTRVFIVLYLAVHGIIKVFLVISLWRNKLWAYPLGAILISLFVAYQIYRVIQYHSLIQLALIIIDIVILILLRFEYKRLLAKTKSSKSKKNN